MKKHFLPFIALLFLLSGCSQSKSEEVSVNNPYEIEKGATTLSYYDTEDSISVDGFSMEPTFFNGQIVFINAEKECNDGDFGIFQVITPEKTDIYCKQFKYDEYGRRYLHSVSNRADDPEFTEDENTILECIGKIIVL